MMLVVETVAAEEVDVSMEEVVTEDVEEDVDKVEDDTSEDIVEGAAAHMQMVLISHMSPVTLKIQSGPHSQTIQKKRSLRTRYTQSSWKMKRGEPPALSVLKRIKRTG